MLTFEFNASADLRRHKRILLRSIFHQEVSTRYRNNSGTGPEKFGSLHSISTYGLFVQTRLFPEVGSNVRLKFSFNGQRIECEGLVIYVNPEDDGLNAQGFGVRFTKMLSKDYDIIRNAIDSYHRTLNI